MDPQGMISQRLYRDGTRYIDGKYIKDLTAINRPLDQTLIIDDNPDCISMQVSACVLPGEMTASAALVGVARKREAFENV